MNSPVFRKSVWLPADIEQVFSFHRDPANLEHVQPPGAHVIESGLPAQLAAGSVCSLRIKVPFGVQDWTIQVDELSLSDDGQQAVMIDRAIISPFAFWVHRHQFERSGSGTLMRDEVEFQPPGGVLSWVLIPPAYLMLQALFTCRHFKTVRYFETISKDGQ